MSQELRLWSVRGATKAGRNDPEAIVSATEELMRELLERLAWRLESEAERRVDREARSSPPDLVGPTEWERSEIYIG